MQKSHNIVSSRLDAFSVFIPKGVIPEDKCVLPEKYLKELAYQAQYYKSNGAKYTLASDSKSMTAEQWNNLGKICKSLDIKLLDISKLPRYPGPWVTPTLDATSDEKATPAHKKFSMTMKHPFGCYIDYTKLMLVDLAGQKYNGKTYKDVLVLDFDLEYDEQGASLQVFDNTVFALSDRRKHYTHSQESPSYENAMIYVASPCEGLRSKPNKKDFHLFRTLIEITFDDIKCKISGNAPEDEGVHYEAEDDYIYGQTTGLTLYQMLDSKSKIPDDYHETAPRDGYHMISGAYKTQNDVQTWNEPEDMLPEANTVMSDLLTHESAKKLIESISPKHTIKWSDALSNTKVATTLKPNDSGADYARGGLVRFR